MTKILAILLFAYSLLPLQSQDEAPKQQTDKQEMKAVSNGEAPPVTWEDLGVKHLAGYSTDEITLINLLNENLLLIGTDVIPGTLGTYIPREIGEQKHAERHRIYTPINGWRPRPRIEGVIQKGICFHTTDFVTGVMHIGRR